MKPIIELHIETLYLHGVPPEQRAAAVAALERGLIEQFSTTAVPGWSARETAYVDVGVVHGSTGSPAQRSGATGLMTQAACAISRALLK
jgi:hypothetical protein